MPFYQYLIFFFALIVAPLRLCRQVSCKYVAGIGEVSPAIDVSRSVLVPIDSVLQDESVVVDQGEHVIGRVQSEVVAVETIVSP